MRGEFKLPNKKTIRGRESDKEIVRETANMAGRK